MQIFSSASPSSTPNPVVLAAGFFDGLHRGHLAVLQAALSRANTLHSQAWVLAFDRHPRSVISPNNAPLLMTTLEQRLNFFSHLGFDGTFLLSFNKSTAAQSPSLFAESLCLSFPALREIHCGSNWRFGVHASGTPSFLESFGISHHFTVSVAPDVLYENAPISSTRIRHAISSGNLPCATTMLGHPYSIRATVIHGRQIGSANGIATANFSPTNILLPPLGVYIVSAQINNTLVRGVANLGFRPTFADARPDSPSLEVHFLDFSGNLYDQTLDIHFHTFLRPEQSFPSPAELFAQIQRDIAAAHSFPLTLS